MTIAMPADSLRAGTMTDTEGNRSAIDSRIDTFSPLASWFSKGELLPGISGGYHNSINKRTSSVCPATST